MWDLSSYLVLDRKCISIKVINFTDNSAGLSHRNICCNVILDLITDRELVMAGFGLYRRLLGRHKYVSTYKVTQVCDINSVFVFNTSLSLSSKPQERHLCTTNLQQQMH